jgi:hypothetical protein
MGGDHRLVGQQFLEPLGDGEERLGRVVEAADDGVLGLLQLVDLGERPAGALVFVDRLAGLLGGGGDLLGDLVDALGGGLDELGVVGLGIADLVLALVEDPLETGLLVLLGLDVALLGEELGVGLRPVLEAEIRRDGQDHREHDEARHGDFEALVVVVRCHR